MSNPDQAGFEQLFDAEAYRLAWGYACRLSAGRFDAEDLLQETLLQAMGKLGQLKDPASFRSWLLAIMRRRWLSDRRRRPLPLAESYVFEDLQAQRPDACPHELADALRRLPPRQREAIELVYISGLRVDETGAVLGCSAHAASQLLGRGRENLRRLLGPESDLATCTGVRQ